MDQKRANLFWAWCTTQFPDCVMTTTQYIVDAVAVDAQSYLRFHAPSADSPNALLTSLTQHVLWEAPSGIKHKSVHMGFMNRTFDPAPAPTASESEAFLYMRQWGFPDETSLGTWFVDKPSHLTFWPIPDPDLRGIYFDWTVFAWQWRLLVGREGRREFGCELHNVLDEAVMRQVGSGRVGPPSRAREITLALDMNKASTRDAHLAHQPRWRGLLNALRTLFMSRHKSFYLSTCDVDGVWLGLVAALYALDQGRELDSWVLIWQDHEPLDLAQLAWDVAQRFNDPKVALAACMLFWVDTRVDEVALVEDVLARLNGDSDLPLRESKGADFRVSLDCLIHGHGYALDNTTPQILLSCDALCRAVWQRQHVHTKRLERVESIVYSRVFWEAWGLPCPDFVPAVVECIDWMNLVNNSVVNGGLPMPLARVFDKAPPGDGLWHGLAGHVSS
jgi:hypothetical protein